MCWQALYMEREGLSSTLDESADRIVMLEKEARERDCLVREHHSQTRSQVLIRDQMKVTDGAGHEAMIILCCRFGTSKKRVMN